MILMKSQLRIWRYVFRENNFENVIFENVFFFLREQFWKNIFWGYQLWPKWPCSEKTGELKICVTEQSVNNSGCSSIQFLLRKIYQKFKNVLLSFSGGQESSISWNIKIFLKRIFLFFEVGLKSYFWNIKSLLGFLFPQM